MPVLYSLKFSYISIASGTIRYYSYYRLYMCDILPLVTVIKSTFEKGTQLHNRRFLSRLPLEYVKLINTLITEVGLT